MKFSIAEGHGAYTYFETCDKCKAVLRLADKHEHAEWHNQNDLVNRDKAK